MKIFSPLQVADIKSTLKAYLHKLGLRVFMRPRNDVAEDTKNTTYYSTLIRSCEQITVQRGEAHQL